VIGGERHRIGKEVDRRWEEGDDLEAMHQTPIEYTRKASRAKMRSGWCGGWIADELILNFVPTGAQRIWRSLTRMTVQLTRD